MPLVYGPLFNDEYSMSFDGTDDYVDTSFIIPAISTYSFSLWIKHSGAVAWNQFEGVFGDMNSGGQAVSGRAVIGFRNTTGTIYFHASMGDGSSYWYDNSTYDAGAIFDNQWHHIALTVNLYTQKLYIDGSLVHTYDTSTGGGGGSSAVPAGTIGVRSYWIGNAYQSTTGTWDGNIDEVAIWDKALTPAEVSALYSNGKPNNVGNLAEPPTAWWRLGDNAVFKYPQWLLPENSNKDKVSNYSLEFDGTDDYVSVPSDAAYKPTTGEFSVSLWFYATTGYDSVMSGGGFAHLNTGFEVNLTNQAKFILSDGSASTTATESSYFTMNAWNHFLGTWDGSNMTVYINGVAGTPVAFAGPISWDAAKALYFGTRYVYLSSPYHGNLCDIAIFDNDQSANAVAIYNSGVPTDLTGYSGLVGYWRMGDMAYSGGTADIWVVPDSSTNNHTGFAENMDIEDRVGDAPSSSGNTLSYNMELNDRTTDVPT